MMTVVIFQEGKKKAVKYSVIFAFSNNGTKASVISCSTLIGSGHQLGNRENFY